MAGSVVYAEDYWTPRGAPLSEEGRTKTLEMVEPRKEITQIPYEISQPGSYYLAGTVFGVAGSNGITILCGDVKLDMNGFSLIGVADSLHGISIPSPVDNIMVRNGALRNWGQYGMDALYATDSSYFDVKVYGNGLSGLVVGENSFVLGCSAYGNGFLIGSFPGYFSDGMVIKDYSTVVECKSRNNRGAGFNIYKAVKMTGCTAMGNRHMGIWGYTYCTIRDCLATRNYCDGIRAYGNCRVEANNCGENGVVASGDSATYGYGSGIALSGTANRIEDNNAADNDYGINVLGSGQGNLIVRNSASGNVITDFSTSSSGDYMGYLYDSTDLSGGSTGFVADNPWSNFEF
jgi:parallel beta-helix repeat protein